MSIQSKPRCVVEAAGAILAQCADLTSAVDDRAFRTPSARISGGTLGKHLRHVVDHFRAALDGFESTIDYDHRDRDVPMEADRALAVREIGRVRERLAALAERDLARDVRIRVMVSGDGAEAELGSTLARELHFAMHHAIHHQAMMKSIAGEFGFVAAPEFGTAPSTLNHELSRA